MWEMLRGGSAISPTTDLEILDAEPWNERTQIDVLIDLQQQAFDADRMGNPGLFGAIVMKMSQIESSIENHSEAMSYAYEAIDAFERCGNRIEDMISAYSAVAKEHCILYSPDFCFKSLHEALGLRIGVVSGVEEAQPPGLIDDKVQPLLRLVRSYTATYLSTRWVHDQTGDNEHPSYYIPETPRPSRDSTEGLIDRLNNLMERPVFMTASQALSTVFRLQTLYGDMSARRLKLCRADRKQAKAQADAMAKVAFRLMCRDTAVADAFQDRGFTINDIAKMAA